MSSDTDLTKPIDIYKHVGSSGGYGIRVNLPGMDRIDLDGYTPTELAESCARRLLARKHRAGRGAKTTVKLAFEVWDRCRTFEPGKSAAVKLGELEVSASMRTIEKPLKPAAKAQSKGLTE